MKRRFLVYLFGFILVSAGPRQAAPATPKTDKAPQIFTGDISDRMCGLEHMKHEGGPQAAKNCTKACVLEGADYVLADHANQKVYLLSDQEKASKFPGEKVRVTGTLNGETIQVVSIEAAK